MSTELDQVWSRLAAVEASAGSADGFVVATVGAHGDLRGLDLDPRALRAGDAAALAAAVLTAVTEATAAAAAEGARLAAPLLGPRAGDGPVDLAFDPALRELDRLLSG